MKALFGSLIAGWFLLAFAGCSQISVVTVTGTSNSDIPIPSHVTYAVLPVAEVEKDPSFQKYADIVSHQMDVRDYRKTSPQTAHLGVFLLYKTREGTSKTGGVLGGAGNSVDYTMTRGSAPSSTGPGMYTHQLVIVVVDFKKSNSTAPLVELWRGETKNVDSSKELLPIAPLMVEAAFRHFKARTRVDHPLKDAGLSCGPSFQHLAAHLAVSFRQRCQRYPAVFATCHRKSNAARESSRSSCASEYRNTLR